jgi:hypothetical protein
MSSSGRARRRSASDGAVPRTCDRPLDCPDDYLVRYVKCLIWWTLTRPACYVAVALGCLLYSYPPEALVRLMSQLQARFPRAHLFGGDYDAGRTRVPSAHDRQLVERALTRFTPWGTAHVPAPALDQSLLDTHFARASVCSD